MAAKDNRFAGGSQGPGSPFLNLESPFLDSELVFESPGSGRREPPASTLAYESPFLDAQIPLQALGPEPAVGASPEYENEPGSDTFADDAGEAEPDDLTGESRDDPESDEPDEMLFESFAPVVSQADLGSRIDEYLDKANATYTLPDKTQVRALPQFRYAKAGFISEAKKALARVLTGSFEKKHPRAVHNAVYGRPTIDQLIAITQALIDAGELDLVARDHPALKGGLLVRKLQRRFRIGIDCAGYVQLAFIHAFMGSDKDTPAVRRSLGLQVRRGDERLSDLPGSHFTKVKFTDAQPGDLFIFRPRPGDADRAWHTVIVRTHTTSGTEHRFEVDASWGTDLYGEAAGGVARRTLVHDTSSGDWWDVHPLTGAEANRNSSGPYAGHIIHGMFRPRHSAARTRISRELRTDEDPEQESPFLDAEEPIVIQTSEPGAEEAESFAEVDEPEWEMEDDDEVFEQQVETAGRIAARILWPALGFPAVIAPRPTGPDDPLASSPTRAICALVLSNRKYLSKEDAARYLRIVTWTDRTRRDVAAGPESSFSPSEIQVRNDAAGGWQQLTRSQSDKLSQAVVFGNDRDGNNGIVVSLARRVREFYRKQGLAYLHEIRVSESASARLRDERYHLLWNSEAADEHKPSDEMRLLVDAFARPRRKALGAAWQQELGFLVDEYQYEYGALHPPYDLKDSQRRLTEVLHPVFVQRQSRSLRIGHVTDTHVDVRADVYEANLTRARQSLSFNNFNRSFVESYTDAKANSDVILLTGDLIDYGRGHVGLAFNGRYANACGKDDAYHEDRNWFLFYYLLASRDSYKVPCYTILGNHDWRLNPYPPFAPGAPDPKSLIHNYRDFTEDERKQILKVAHGPGHERRFAYTLTAESTVGLVFKSPAAAARGLAGKLDTKGSPLQTTVESVAWYLMLINPFLDYAFAHPAGQQFLMIDWAENEEVMNPDEPRTFMGFGQRASDCLSPLQQWHLKEFAAVPGKAKVIGVHAPPLGPYPEWSDQELLGAKKTYARGVDSRARRPDGKIIKLETHTTFAIRPKDAPFGVAADHGSFLRGRDAFIRTVANPNAGIRVVLSGHIHRNGLLVAYAPASDPKAMIVRSVSYQSVRGIRPPRVAVGAGGAYGAPLYANTTSAGPRGNLYNPGHSAVSPGFAIVTVASDGTIENVSQRQIAIPAAPVKVGHELEVEEAQFA